MSRQAYLCLEDVEMDPALSTCAGDPRKLLYYRRAPMNRSRFWVAHDAWRTVPGYRTVVESIIRAMSIATVREVLSRT
jgi:hypothetical protein